MNHVFVFCLFVLKFFTYFYVWCTGSSLLHVGFSLVEASGSYSLVVVYGHLFVVTSFVVEALGHGDSVVVALGLSCPEACGILSNQGSNRCPLHWQVDSYPLTHQGSLNHVYFNEGKSHQISSRSCWIWQSLGSNTTCMHSGVAWRSTANPAGKVGSVGNLGGPGGTRGWDSWS